MRGLWDRLWGVLVGLLFDSVSRQAGYQAMNLLSRTPLYPEAYQCGTWLNPQSGDWPCARNNPICGYWFAAIIANNPPAPLTSGSK